MPRSKRPVTPPTPASGECHHPHDENCPCAECGGYAPSPPPPQPERNRLLAIFKQHLSSLGPAEMELRLKNALAVPLRNEKPSPERGRMSDEEFGRLLAANRHTMPEQNIRALQAEARRARENEKDLAAVIRKQGVAGIEEIAALKKRADRAEAEAARLEEIIEGLLCGNIQDFGKSCHELFGKADCQACVTRAALSEKREARGEGE